MISKVTLKFVEVIYNVAGIGRQQSWDLGLEFCPFQNIETIRCTVNCN